MPNEINKMFERLNLNEDMEMMRHELSRMMEEELSKPADEVDVELVEEILALLEVEAPEQEEQDACWAAIQKNMKKNRSRRTGRIVRRCAAIAAAIVVMFFVSLGTARAFRWTFLLKLLAPVAETFGIYSTSNLETETSDTQAGEGLVSYSFIDTEYEQVDYENLDEMLKAQKNLKIEADEVPERFEFVQGSVYEDPDIVRTTITFAANEDILTLTSIGYTNDDSVSGYVFERTLDEPVVEYISGKEVTYYHNQTENQLSAAWIDQDVVYMIRGAISEDELRQIIGNLL